MKTINDLLGLIAPIGTEADNRYAGRVWDADISDFNHVFGDPYSSWSLEFGKRVKTYWVDGANWICTDTRVGLCVYVFDGIPVAIGSQTARKKQARNRILFRSICNQIAEILPRMYSVYPRISNC